jgi:hypothetical protein
MHLAEASQVLHSLICVLQKLQRNSFDSSENFLNLKMQLIQPAEIFSNINQPVFALQKISLASNGVFLL